MQSKSVLKIVNFFLIIDFTVLGLSGILNSRIPYEIYSVVHPAAGFSFIILAALHITLNRKWIVQTYLKRK